MKEYLKDIKYTMQQENNEKLRVQQEKDLKEKYNKFLHDTVVDTIQQVFVDFKYEKEAYEELLLNSNKYERKIVKAVANYYEEKKVKKGFVGIDSHIEIERYYIFDNFDIENDLNKIYFKTVKNIYAEYKEKDKINKERISLYLEKNIYNCFNNFGYVNAYNFMSNLDYKDMIIDELTDKESEKDYLRSIYFKILSKVSREFKKAHKLDKNYNRQVKTQPRRVQQRKTKQNVVLRHKGAILLGSFVYGTIKGFVDVAKKS